MLRIGVLLPRSTLFPSFGLDILNGIKICLKHYNLSDDYKLLTENIGFGIEEAEVYSKAEKLLLQEDADIVIAVADLNIAELLGPLFNSSNKLLLIVSMGVGIPDNWRPAPTTIIHSMNLSFHTRLTGKLAARESVSKKGAYALSYYDAGYRHTYSMMNSHQQSGGEPMYTHVTHLKAEEFTLAPLEHFLTEHTDVKSLLCLFTADMATQFYQAITPMQEQLELELYGSPMLLEAYPSTTPAPSVKGYTSWDSEINNKANILFKDLFKKSTNKEATMFGVLGWDTGLLLKAMAEQFQQGNTNAASIIPALAEKNYDSPRGWMKLDPVTYYTYTPSWLITIEANGADKVIKELDTTDSEWKEFSSEHYPEDSYAGWRNTYLCI